MYRGLYKARTYILTLKSLTDIKVNLTDIKVNLTDIKVRTYVLTFVGLFPAGGANGCARACYNICTM
jgi:hypothetical protein